METGKQRKTDRRTRYTCMAIKESLLGLLAEKDFEDITVADICRKAELNRGTFYLHYSHIIQVLDELFDDALSRIHSVFVQVGCLLSDGEKRAYPLCRFLRENQQYQPLFFSDSLHSYMISKLMNNSKETYIARLRDATKLSEAALESIVLFQLSGCLAVCKKYAGSEDGAWSEIQCGVDSLLRDGFQGFCRPGDALQDK